MELVLVGGKIKELNSIVKEPYEKQSKLPWGTEQVGSPPPPMIVGNTSERYHTEPQHCEVWQAVPFIRTI